MELKRIIRKYQSDKCNLENLKGALNQCEQAKPKASIYGKTVKGGPKVTSTDYLVKRLDKKKELLAQIEEIEYRIFTIENILNTIRSSDTRGYKAFTMRHLENRSFVTIADALNISHYATKTLIFKMEELFTALYELCL